MTQVWESNIGPASRRLVLLALADSANDEGVCWPSIATLAHKANIARTTTEDAIRSLETDGLIVRNRRFNDSNVYEIVTARLVATPPEIRGTPPEIHGSPPPESGGPPPEIPGTNRKGTKNRNLKTSDAAAPEQAALDLPLPADLEKPAEEEKELTLNQRATRGAQWYYERLGKMGNVPAFMKIIRQAMQAGYTDGQIKVALGFIADHQWTLTGERLANTLRGGPKPASSLPANGQRQKVYLPSGMELQT